MGEEILKDLVKRLAAVVALVQKDLGGVRTGRAKPSLVEGIKAEAYGTYMALSELSSISAPDTTLIVISPWDKSLVSAIAAAIRKSDLNINPIVDGETIKIAIPPLSSERREELVKLVHQKLESGKVMVRQVRTEIKEQLEKLEGEAGVSEDNVKMWLTKMQKQVDDCMLRVEQLGKEKEVELRTL